MNKSRKPKLVRMLVAHGITVKTTKGTWISVPAESELVGVQDRGTEIGWHAIMFNNRTPEGIPCFVGEMNFKWLVKIPL